MPIEPLSEAAFPFKDLSLGFQLIAEQVYAQI
jgi:hypothetical protein